VRTARGATAREFGRDPLAARAGRIETRRDPNGNDAAGESLWATRAAQFLVVKTEKANPSYVSNLLIMSTRFDTHEVVNQPPPLSGYDVFGGDAALSEALAREGAGWAVDELHALGRQAGSEVAQELGRRANENPPVLVTHDRYGNRVDRVRYHPAYHELMTAAVGHGLHGAPWADPRAGAHVARAAKIIVWYQVDGGHICPISMTYSVVPALRHAPGVA